VTRSGRTHHVSWLSALFSMRGSPSPPGRYGANEAFFNDSPQKNAILSPNVESYLARLREAKQQSPYAVSQESMPLLQHAGIIAPAPHSPAHSHPVHVALERQSLSFVKGMLEGINWFGLFIGADKLATFTPPTDLFNPVIVGKDRNRYRRTLGHQAKPPSNGASVWFAHDALHHFSPSEIGSWFDAHPNLNVLIATIVAPVEAAEKMRSVWPRLYSLRYKGNFVQYTPEGDAPGAYWQPRDAYRWIRAPTLITPNNECLHIGVVHSRFSTATPSLWSVPRATGAF
jgi:hypothetical protein